MQAKREDEIRSPEKFKEGSGEMKIEPKAKGKRIYKSGGTLRYQTGYLRNGSFVRAHWKTYPDTKLNNNRKSLLGY